MSSVAASRRSADGAVLRRKPGLAELQPHRYQRRRRLIDTSLAWGVPIILIALWEAGADGGLFRVQFFPAPSAIVAEAVSLVKSGELQSNLAISLERVAIGLTLGVPSAPVAGWLLGPALSFPPPPASLSSPSSPFPNLPPLPLF